MLFALSEVNLRINSKKINLFLTKVTFLGFEINTEDNFKSIPDSKLKHLLAWSIPSCKAELNSFLCVCTYYGMVVPFVRLLAVPLLHLLKSSADFYWTNTEQISFENIMYLAIMSIKVYFPEKIYLCCSHPTLQKFLGPQHYSRR